MKILINEKLSEHKYKTPEGYLICVDSVLARTGKQTYTRNEIFHDGKDEEIEIDRTEEEVFSDETLASFENKPLTEEHPEEDVTPLNYREHAVGFVRDIKRGLDMGKPVMLGTLVITDADAIEAVESGKYKELSCGYDCDINDEANPCQRNIRGNHVALCEQGRAGNARVVDSVEDEVKIIEDSIKDSEAIVKISYITSVAHVQKIAARHGVSTIFVDMDGSKSFDVKFVGNRDRIQDVIDYLDDEGVLIKVVKDSVKDGAIYVIYAEGTDKGSRALYRRHTGPARYCNEADAETFTEEETKKILNSNSGKYVWKADKVGEEPESDSILDVEPRSGESKEDFIERFMTATKSEYPDIKQRYAVANSYWNRRDSMKDGFGILSFGQENKVRKYCQKYEVDFNKVYKTIEEMNLKYPRMKIDDIIESVLDDVVSGFYDSMKDAYLKLPREEDEIYLYRDFRGQNIYVEYWGRNKYQVTGERDNFKEKYMYENEVADYLDEVRARFVRAQHDSIDDIDPYAKATGSLEEEADNMEELVEDAPEGFDKDYALQQKFLKADINVVEQLWKMNKGSASDLFQKLGYKKDGNYTFYKDDKGYRRVVEFRDFDDIRYYVLKDGKIPQGWTVTRRTYWGDSINDNSSDLTNIKVIKKEVYKDADDGKTHTLSLVEYIPQGNVDDGTMKSLWATITDYHGEKVWTKGAIIDVSRRLAEQTFDHQLHMRKVGRDRYLRGDSVKDSKLDKIIKIIKNIRSTNK